MKKILVLPFLSLTILLSIPVHGADSSSEIKWRGSGGWGVGLSYAGLFDPVTVRTLSGEVIRVVREVPAPGMAEGVVMTLRSRDETLTVHLGPLWFLERQDALMLLPGDTLEVRGSLVSTVNGRFMVASELTRKGRVLRLRDPQGLPVWSAWRQQ